MFKILEKKRLTEESYSLRISAPMIGKKARQGQFVMLRIDEGGERIPLTIADFDKESVTVVFQVIGRTTGDLQKLKEGDSILDLVGPLGNPTNMLNDDGKLRKNDTIVCVGGGLGVACIYPIARGFFQNGNKVIIIAGARTKDLLLWLDKMEKVCDELIICTDDGTFGRKGFVTDAMKELLDKQRVDLVITVGPPIMMKFVAKTTLGRAKTYASLNPIMVDGTGMCGGCRVLVGKKVKFACVDGPEFDAHQVDFDDLMNRNTRYQEEEHHCKCH